jgi:rhodanese-related sulfurtransferase
MRAATASSLLKHHGAHDVIHVVDGGVPALAAAGLQLEPDGETAASVTI